MWQILLLLAVLGPGVQASEPGLSLFNSGEHCVAYKTRKTLFLVRTVDVVGRNCESTSEILPEVGGRYYVEVNIPIDAFKSGEPERDRDVAKILSGGGTSRSIKFKTASMSKEEWLKLFQQGSFALEGSLEIAGQAHPLRSKVKILRGGDDGVEVDGLVVTNFKSLGIDPPRLAFGMMARVREEIELHFHLLGNKTLGINSLF